MLHGTFSGGSPGTSCSLKQIKNLLSKSWILFYPLAIESTAPITPKFCLATSKITSCKMMSNILAFFFNFTITLALLSTRKTAEARLCLAEYLHLLTGGQSLVRPSDTTGPSNVIRRPFSFATQLACFSNTTSYLVFSEDFLGVVTIHTPTDTNRRSRGLIH